MARSLCIAQISQSAQKGQQSRLVTSTKITSIGNQIYIEQLKASKPRVVSRVLAPLLGTT